MGISSTFSLNWKTYTYLRRLVSLPLFPIISKLECKNVERWKKNLQFGMCAVIQSFNLSPNFQPMLRNLSECESLSKHVWVCSLMTACEYIVFIQTTTTWTMENAHILDVLYFIKLTSFLTHSLVSNFHLLWKKLNVCRYVIYTNIYNLQQFLRSQKLVFGYPKLINVKYSE